MQKICAVILLSALASNYEALPQTKWSRPIRNSQGQLTRERRQFPFGEWIPLSQPCPTCRPFADPLDVGLRGENIGLTPPRPPTVTRQIHGEGNFFPQDESSILSVPPPPPSALPRHPIPSNNGNFQFSTFGQQFNPPLTISSQKIFPQTQQIQFLPQTFLSNQPLLVNGNQQIVSDLNTQSNLFRQEQNHQQINNGKVNFNSEFKSPKPTENVVLEQNKRPAGAKQAFSNKPQPFSPPQQNQQQAFVQQQAFGGQQQHSVNFGDSILTPPPAPSNLTHDIIIPGLNKEEIQLLYVPVETLRQKGTAQEQLLTQQPQNIQFFNRGNSVQRPVTNILPTEQTPITQPKGHFVTQNGNAQGQVDGTFKVTSAQPFVSSVTPSTILLQHLPFQQTPQSFVSATPATPTIQPFVTPASVFQKFSSFTPETTLPHLPTVPNTIQFSQSDIEFGTTPKTIINQGAFNEEIITGKSQLSGLKSTGLSQEQGRPLQQPLNQQQQVTQQPQLSTAFPQEQQKQVLQIDQQQIALQKQQDQHRLLQHQRQKELEEQRFLEQQRKQKELEEHRQQQRQKELEEQRLLQQQRQKELEEQRFLQKQKELEEQRLLQQQRQKELEQQRFLQKQKELEEQRLLQQRQKELEQQRFLQKQKELEEQRLLQQRQKELEEQRFLQEQRQRELENQRRQQIQKQKELEEKLRFQQKQKEEEQRLLRFQQQQKELQQQRLLQLQQEEQERILQQEKLQKQKQENLKKQQQFQFYQQQQKQNIPHQGFQTANKHVLPANDKLNLIPQLEKESETQDQQLVPHQPPLSVFYKGYNGAEARITDVLRELRSSNTITVLDQYFEKMPKVFVGPAGLIPPAGYGKFELPYLSNIESNRIERRIDKLPFFVAPLNFEPPPGYAKIPFPAPHIGSVVVSSESNPAMTLKTAEKGSVEEDSFSVVGPELPGLINNLGTETTTLKPATYVSTPSLPQTTAQLRNRRPNNSIYKPQSRKPITRTRPTTTSKPEEEVTQPLQVTKDSEGGVRKPFNRFLNRRRQQIKTTTEGPVRNLQDKKSLENRHYSVEVYHQEKNQLPRTQQKSDVIEENRNEDSQFNRQFAHEISSIDQITPGGHGVFEVRPTQDYGKVSPTGNPTELEEHRPEVSDYAEINLQSFEDGPLPTGSAKTITQELYRPNAINQAQGEINSKTLYKNDNSQTSVKYQSGLYENFTPTTFSEASDVESTAGRVDQEDSVSEAQLSAQPTSVINPEEQEGSYERYDTTEVPQSRVFYTSGPVTTSGEQNTKGHLGSNEQYTSAFAEISKPHHIPGFIDSSKGQHSKFSDIYPTASISVDLQAPLLQNQHSQEFERSSEVKPTQNSAEFSEEKQNQPPTEFSHEQVSTGFEGVKNQQSLDISTTQVNPSTTGVPEEKFNAGFSVNSQREGNGHDEDQRIGSFISLHDVQSTADYPVNPEQYFPSPTPFSSRTPVTGGVKSSVNQIIVDQDQSQISSTPETVEVTVNPSVQTYTPASALEGSVNLNDQTRASEGQGRLSNDHRLKLPNPSIVKVRTRVRGKSRGQVNFAASQSTTPIPFTRSTVETKISENAEQEHATKGSHFRDYNPVKISKYNQYRGVKKPQRTTTEATTEYEHKANIYTIRPPRRPLNPSTVSTKRIRRPTTPVPFAESETETYGISTVSPYSQPEQSDISPSGVSNDVYYEQSSLSPAKHKLRKHFGSAEQKNDVVPAFASTPATYSTFAHEGYSEESYAGKDLIQTGTPSESPEKYPEWNPSESGFDVSGVVLTTIRTPAQEEQIELEEPKKTLDSKKAFDPDLEKKTGRRRVRVRVHKRPHENFETAESQNLRTVANVLVPPTTTYKPNDESSFQLAKNADFSFGGQKLFGLRSREYFRKRLNLTQPEGVEEQPAGEHVQGGETEKREKTKVSDFLKKDQKTQKNDVESVSAASNESREGNKFVRPKFRSFVRKIVKHGGASKESDSESNQVDENEKKTEGKHENSELYSRQPFRLNQSGINHTGRINGTRHKTFVRYVKKNKLRQETEPNEESSSKELQTQEQGLQQTTELHTSTPETSNTENQVREVEGSIEEKKPETQLTEHYGSQQTEHSSSQRSESSQEAELIQTQQPIIQTTQGSELTETQESSSHSRQDEVSNNAQSTTPQTQSTGLHISQKPKFHQTLRPIFQRITQRPREPETPTPATEKTPEPQEKRNSFTRLKYTKTTGFGTTGSETTEEAKKVNEQQLKNKNLHTLEVRKYLRTKNREGAFSQFSKNKYFTSEKTESAEIEKDQHITEKESEEIATEKVVESSSVESKTTQDFVPHTDSTKEGSETTENDEESELQVSTTETISSSEEENSEEDDTSHNFETTTEIETPTTVPQTGNLELSENTENTTESKTTIQTTEGAPIGSTEYQPDIYRFSKHSFSFDEAEKFTGTKNRAHVRNITTDIIENTASFSAPGVEKRPEIRVVTHRVDDGYPATESHSETTQNDKTEETTAELKREETTTDYPETAKTETTASAEAITKAKAAKIFKTSTTTKISHETEICFRGKCIRTKSENPDEDLKLLVDSANTMKIAKRKT